MVSLSHYPEGLNGFGSFAGDRQAVADQLQKALEAGYATTNQTGGAALRVQSLEQSLKVLSYTNRHFKIWPKIHKSPAYSTAEEYNQVTSYGDPESGAFTREGELGQSQDSSYVRRTAYIKYMCTQREVSHPMTMVVPAHGDVIAQQNQEGILWLLAQITNSLYHGDASLAWDGEAEQFDGLDALIDINSYLDMEGLPVQEQDVEEGSNIIVESFGYPDEMFVGTKAMSDMAKQFYPRERVNLPAPKEGRVGLSVKSMETQAGTMNFNSTVFLKQLKSPPTAATSPNAPNPPTSMTANVATPYDVAGSAEWDKLLGTVTATVDFSYCVTACNRFGESAPVYFNRTHTIAAINANQAFVIDVTNAAVLGANVPEFFRIYRTLPDTTSANPADFSEILKVPVLNQIAATINTAVAVDRNFLLPFTEIAYLGQMDRRVLTFRQLAPLMKMDLAVLSPAYRWMILLYGTPILFAPKKWMRMINIGRL